MIQDAFQFDASFHKRIQKTIREFFSSIVKTHNRYIYIYIYEHTSRNTFHFRNNDSQGCVECINFDDKSIMAKYWPISSPWPFANCQRLLPLLRLSCCIMQFSLRFLLRLIPPNRTISLYKYVGRDMIYSCTTIFVIGRRRVVAALEDRNSVVSGSRIPSSLYTRWWTKADSVVASIDPLTRRNGAWIPWLDFIMEIVETIMDFKRNENISFIIKWKFVEQD